MSQPNFLLIDASGFAHRAFHAANPVYRASDGMPIWAILGFLGLMWRLLGAAQADEPTHAAAVFDYPGPTFRKTLFPAYKANRPARDQELAVQLPYLRHAAQMMGIQPIEAQGFEADDVIATLARVAERQGWRVTIVSSDKDFQQLVSPLIEIVDPVAHRRITEKDVKTGRFGVSPLQVPDVQALAGDSIDNIPGIDGIGEKSASQMIRRWGSIKGVIAAAKDPSQAFHIRPGQRAELKVAGCMDRLELYRDLAVLRDNLQVDGDLETFALQPIVREHIDTLLKTLEATSRFDSIFAQEPKMMRVVERCSDPWEWWREEIKAPGQELWADPQQGFYMRRLVKGGPFVPARIWREPDVDPITEEPTGADRVRCEVGDEARDPVLEWPVLARNPVTREKYEFEVADARWTKTHQPHHPKASPSKPIDWKRLPLE